MVTFQVEWQVERQLMSFRIHLSKVPSKENGFPKLEKKNNPFDFSDSRLSLDNTEAAKTKLNFC
jgi:hypothetical protein